MRLTHHREWGQVLPLATILIVLLFSLTGLAMETGLAYYTRQTAHAAAESAAMAAVLAVLPSVSGTSVSCTSAVNCSSSPVACSSSPNNPPVTNFDNACLYAKQNGFTNANGTQVYVTANNTSPAPNNPNVSVLYWAQVAVKTRQPQLFSAVFSAAGMSTGARATAALIGSGTPSGCVYVLNPNAQRAMDIEGSSITTTCGIYINSNNSVALYIGGNPPSGNYAIKSSSTAIVGNYQNGGQGLLSPAPLTGQTAVADPLASLQPPAVGSCNYNNFNWSQGTTSMSPGVYCGGIHISGGTVTMQPGEYILNGGGLTIDSASTTVTGSGVSFYNTATSGYSYGTMTISGQPKVTFSAPTSGAMQGIFWFTDRNDTSSNQNQINGATNSTIQGTIYMPNCPLLYTGESSSGTYTALVVNKLTLNGSTNFLQDPTGQYTGLSGGGASAFLIE